MNMLIIGSRVAAAHRISSPSAYGRSILRLPGQKRAYTFHGGNILYRLSNDIPAEGGCIRIAYNIIPEHSTAGNHHTIQLTTNAFDNCFTLGSSAYHHLLASYQVPLIFASAPVYTQLHRMLHALSTMVFICSSSSSQTSKINSSNLQNHTDFTCSSCIFYIYGISGKFDQPAALRIGAFIAARFQFLHHIISSRFLI